MSRSGPTQGPQMGLGHLQYKDSGISERFRCFFFGIGGGPYMPSEKNWNGGINIKENKNSNLLFDNADKVFPRDIL